MVVGIDVNKNRGIYKTYFQRELNNQELLLLRNPCTFYELPKLPSKYSYIWNEDIQVSLKSGIMVGLLTISLYAFKANF